MRISSIKYSIKCSIQLALGLLLALVVYSPLQAETKLTADLLKASGAQGWTRLQGNVRLLKTETGLELTTQRLEFFRDSEAVSLFQLQATGGVKIKLGLRTLTSQTARYNHITGHLLMQGAVRMEDETSIILAEQFEFFEKEKNGSFISTKGERVHLQTKNKSVGDKDRQIVEILSEEIRFSQKDKKIHLQGKVFLQDEEKNAKLSTERAELFFDDANTLLELRAFGQFHLQQPGRESTAEQAFLDYKTQRITLTGNAYVKDENQGVLRSEHIEMSMDANKGVVRSQQNQLLKIEIQLD